MIKRSPHAIGKLHIHVFPTGLATLLDEIGKTGWTTEPLTGAVLFANERAARHALYILDPPSSSGKTPDFGSGIGGSNPSGGTI